MLKMTKCIMWLEIRKTEHVLYSDEVTAHIISIHLLQCLG